MTQQEIFFEYLNKSEDVLWVELGKTTPAGSSHGMLPKTPKQLANYGKILFQEKLPAIKKAICHSEPVTTLLNTGERIENIHICILIADMLLHVLEPLHLPIITVIVTKKGLAYVCDHPA